MSNAPHTPRPVPVHRLRRAGIIGAVVVVAVVATGVVTRANDARKLKDWTDQQAVPTVSVVPVERSAAGASLDLPGRLEAYARRLIELSKLMEAEVAHFRLAP